MGGEPTDIDDPGELIRALEASRLLPENTLGGLLSISCGLGGAQLPQEAVAVGVEGLGLVNGGPEVPVPVATPQQEDVDMLDIERPEDPAKLDPLAATAEGGDTAKADEDKEVEAENKIDRAVLRDIELEVMEMRASMELQALH